MLVTLLKRRDKNDGKCLPFFSLLDSNLITTSKFTIFNLNALSLSHASMHISQRKDTMHLNSMSGRNKIFMSKNKQHSISKLKCKMHIINKHPFDQKTMSMIVHIEYDVICILQSNFMEYQLHYELS